MREHPKVNMTTINDDFEKRLRAIEKKLAVSNQAPTIPSYVSTNFPQDAIHGQIAKDRNDHSLWVYGEDDIWHQSGGGGGGQIGAYARGFYNADSDGVYVITANSDRYVSFNSHRATSDWNAIRFGTIVETNDTFQCNYGFDHGGIYTFFAGIHITTAGYQNVNCLIYNAGSEQFLHLGFMPHAFGDIQVFSTVSVLGLATQEDFAQTRCQSGDAQQVRLRIENRNAFDVNLRWAYLTCTYVPTNDPVVDIGFAG